MDNDKLSALADRLLAHAEVHAQSSSPHDDEQAQWERDLREAASALRSSGEAVAWAVRDHSDGELWMMDTDQAHASRQAELNDDTLVPLYLRPATPASVWRPIAEAQPPAGRLDLWLVSDDNGDYLALARRSSQGWRVDGAGDWKLPFTPTQYCKPPTPEVQGHE